MNSRKRENGNYSLLVRYKTEFGIAEETYLQYVSLNEIEMGKREVSKFGIPGEFNGGRIIIPPNKIVGFRITDVT